MTPQELPAYLQRIRDRIAALGPEDAAYAMARRYHEYLSDVILVRYQHPAGSRTTSPPGEPPAIVSGALKRSVRVSEPRRDMAYRATCQVRPMIVYARIQEIGGTVRAKNPHWVTIVDRNGHRRRVLKGQLHWVTDGKSHFAVEVTLPARPYMRPAHKDTVRDGTLREAAKAAVRDLIY